MDGVESPPGTLVAPGSQVKFEVTPIIYSKITAARRSPARFLTSSGFDLSLAQRRRRSKSKSRNFIFGAR